MPKWGGDPIERDGRLKDEDVLLRYMSYPKFKALFQAGLYFTRADILAKEEPFEGEYADNVYRVHGGIMVQGFTGAVITRLQFGQTLVF
jgi:hypothetical protein